MAARAGDESAFHPARHSLCFVVSSRVVQRARGGLSSAKKTENQLQGDVQCPCALSLVPLEVEP
eukprot:4645963-Prymnesium_polylepis.1